MRKINEIIIHCSATPNSKDFGAEDIHRWHLENGWDGIGYHYVIKIDGVIENGRPDYWPGAHSSGHNKHSIGICLVGTDEYTERQWGSLKRLISGLAFKYQDAKILGHNEISSKACPGFNVQEWLAEIKLIPSVV